MIQRTVQIDSREKTHAIGHILAAFDAQGVSHFVSKLYVGDYANPFNARTVVDRKQSLIEVCANLTQQHERFRAELERARDAGIRLVILVEHGRGIRTLHDVFSWYNPRLRTSPRATTGRQLGRMMYTVAARYGVEWRFCDPAETGAEILKILFEEENT